MKKFAMEIKKDDIFMYNGVEHIALDDYPANSAYLWVTTRRCYDSSGLDRYGPTSASAEYIEPQEIVEYVGNMQEVKKYA